MLLCVIRSMVQCKISFRPWSRITDYESYSNFQNTTIETCLKVRECSKEFEMKNFGVSFYVTLCYTILPVL